MTIERYPDVCWKCGEGSYTSCITKKTECSNRNCPDPPDGAEDGYLEGEVCGRNGCDGVLKEGDKDGCCSCHIAPPCSYCTMSAEYCPKCDWEAEQTG